VSSVTQERSAAAPVPADSGDLSLARVLHGLVRDVTAAGVLVVLATEPGGAPTVAAAIERARIAPILATVAGDATVLTKTRSAIAARVVARYLTAVADVLGVCAVGEAGDKVQAGATVASVEETR
jgi:arginine repressor